MGPDGWENVGPHGAKRYRSRSATRTSNGKGGGCCRTRQETGGPQQYGQPGKYGTHECTSGVFFGFFRLPFSLSHTPAYLLASPFFSIERLLRLTRRRRRRDASNTTRQKSTHECAMSAISMLTEHHEVKHVDRWRRQEPEGRRQPGRLRVLPSIERAIASTFAETKPRTSRNCGTATTTTKEWLECFDDVSAEAPAMELYKQRLEDSLKAYRADPTAPGPDFYTNSFRKALKQHVKLQNYENFLEGKDGFWMKKKDERKRLNEEYQAKKLQLQQQQLQEQQQMQQQQQQLGSPGPMICHNRMSLSITSKASRRLACLAVESKTDCRLLSLIGSLGEIGIANKFGTITITYFFTILCCFRTVLVVPSSNCKCNVYIMIVHDTVHDE